MSKIHFKTFMLKTFSDHIMCITLNRLQLNVHAYELDNKVGGYKILSCIHG